MRLEFIHLGTKVQSLAKKCRVVQQLMITDDKSKKLHE